jgi:hypothetical protein
MRLISRADWVGREVTCGVCGEARDAVVCLPAAAAHDHAADACKGCLLEALALLVDGPEEEFALVALANDGPERDGIRDLIGG